MTKVLIVDDDVAFRHAMGGLLREQFPRIEVREASNGQETLQQIEGLDLLFMDISLPKENGLELTAKIKAEHPGLPIVVLTIHDASEYREAAFQHGADYFVSKGAPAEEILEAVRSIVACTPTAGPHRPARST
ncbi:MAG: response regulator transcription factor [Gammaproteobacteria bacterium]|nr:response regulator transcription factor [Gammaproteobacteria bacterium]